MLMGLVVLGFLVLGCGGDVDRSRPSGPEAESRSVSVAGDAGPAASAPAREMQDVRVVVTGDDDTLPDGCHPRQVARVVADFFDAFNRGDLDRLSRLFFVAEGPSPPDFSDDGSYPWSWYSVSEGGAGGRIESSFITYDQGELLRYFARRHQKRERLRLLKVGLLGPGMLGERGNVGMIYILTREADDIPPGMGGPDGLALGRGAINCERGQIFTWSMEMRTGETRNARDASGWLCRNPPGWKPSETVVACA